VRSEEEARAAFEFVGLGPYTSDGERWCCGGHCAGDHVGGWRCPYGLRLQPGGPARCGAWSRGCESWGTCSCTCDSCARGWHICGERKGCHWCCTEPGAPD